MWEARGSDSTRSDWRRLAVSDSTSSGLGKQEVNVGNKEPLGETSSCWVKQGVTGKTSEFPNK